MVGINLLLSVFRANMCTAERQSKRHKKVQEFMEKHGIGESRVRIFDAELGKEICGIFETGLYYDCEVTGAYPAGRNTVLEVASVTG